MKGYVLRRLLLMVPTLFGITLALFLLIQLVPGGPVEEMLSKVREAAAQTGGADASRAISPEEIDQIRAYYGFDKPRSGWATSRGSTSARAGPTGSRSGT